MSRSARKAKAAGHRLTRLRLYHLASWSFLVAHRWSPGWVEPTYYLGLTLARLNRYEDALVFLNEVRAGLTKAEQAVQRFERRMFRAGKVPWLDRVVARVALGMRMVGLRRPALWLAKGYGARLTPVRLLELLRAARLREDALHARLADPPASGMEWYFVALLQQSLGLAGWACLAAERAAGMAPGWVDPIRLRLRILLEEGYADLAADLLDEAYPVTDRAGDLMARGRTALRVGRFHHAADAFLSVLVQYPDNAAAWMGCARAQHGLRRWGWAYLAAEQANLRSQNRTAARFLMADCLARERDVDRALALLDNAGEIDRDRADSLVTVIRLAFRGKDFETATDLARQALQLEPDHPKAMELMLRSLKELGDTETAETMVKQIEASGSRDLLPAGARYCLEVGDPRSALTLLDGVDHKSGDVLSLEAEALFKLGRLSEAHEVAVRALRIDPRHRTALRWARLIEGEVKASGSWVPLLPRPDQQVTRSKGRILHLVTNSLPYLQSGYTVRTHYVAAAQRAVGLDPHVVTKFGFPATYGHPDAQVAEEIEGVPYHRLSTHSLAKMPPDHQLERYADAAAHLVRRLRPAVLHPATTFQNAVVALALREAYDLPVVYEVRGFQEDTWVSRLGGDAEQSDRYRARQRAELRCMLEANRVVTLAEVMRDELVEWGVPEDTIRIVPNAVDVEAFRPVSRDPRLAGQLGIAPEEVTLGYVSSLVAYEGINYLIEAIALLIERGLRIRGLLVGDGTERPALERLAKDLGVREKVIFTGRVPYDKVLHYYGMIDVFVVPRTNDKVCHLVTPLKPFEAMATGRVLAVSGVGALQEIVEDGETGLVFKPEDPVHLVEVVEPLLEDPELRRRMGNSARRWVKEHRTWRRNALRYFDIYDELGAI